MSSLSRRMTAALLAVLLAACATPQGTVVLLPEAGGRDTSVVVAQGGKEVVLDQTYAGAKLASTGPQKYSSNAAEVQTQFGAAMAALPGRPAQFTLYFVEGKDEFTDASKQNIDSVFAEIASRPVPDVLVIGHTDKVGSDTSNDVLSRQRAEVVRKALIVRGIAPENVVAVGRGKREPVVPTDAGVAEPRNRRVEILVR
jgi:outer membrane protein OmpA-like peptidoglycan-associated protein